MKRTILLVAAALLYAGVSLAQPRINEIRTAYSKALGLIKEFSKKGTSTGINHMQIVTKEEDGGPYTRTIDFYYKRGERRPELDNYRYTLYFIRVKSSGRSHIPEMHEFLLDPTTGQLMFVYRTQSPVDQMKAEWRFYFDETKKLIRYLDSNSPNAKVDEGSKRQANDLVMYCKGYISMLRSSLTNLYTGEGPLLQGQ